MLVFLKMLGAADPFTTFLDSVDLLSQLSNIADPLQNVHTFN